MIDEDDEILSNEDIWAKEREDRLRMAAVESRNINSHQTPLLG